MAQKRRYLVVMLLAGMALFLALLFPQFLLANVLLPVATVAWLLLRIFVLSIDQDIYWLGLIVLVIILILARLMRPAGVPQRDRMPETNPTLERVDGWRLAVLCDEHQTGGHSGVQRQLTQLLVSMYATRWQSVTENQVEKALRGGQIPLPEPIHAFLFPGEPAGPWPGLFKHPLAWGRRAAEALRLAPQQWIRRWTGRETREYYQAIDNVITFMEGTLETNQKPWTQQHP